MIDLLATLSAGQWPCSYRAMTRYWQRSTNVGTMMGWCCWTNGFLPQDSSPETDVLNKVRGLLQHRSFILNNSNRTRSLIGGFASGKPAVCHAADCSGYQFLVEILSDLNQSNPQIATQLIEPLIRLKRYDADRQALMRQALEQLKGLENLSGDLYEKISKAL